MKRNKIMAKALLTVSLAVSLATPNMVAAQEVVNNELNKNQAEVIQEQPKLTLQKALENVNVAKGELDKAQKDYDDISAESSKQNTKKDKLTSDIESHKRDIDNVDIPGTLKNLKETDERTLAEKTTELDKVKKTLEETNKAIEDAKSTLTGKRDKKIELENKIDQMKNQYGELENYADKKAKVEALEKEKSDLERSINDINNTISNLNTDKTAKQAAANELKNDIDALRNKISTLKDKVAKADKDYKDAKKAYETSLANETETQAELKKLANQKSEKEKELETAKAKVAEVEAKLANAEKQLNDQLAPSETEVKLQARVDKAQGEINELQAELETAKTELKDVEDKIAEKAEEIKQAETELATLNSDITGLEDTIKNLEASKSDKVKAYEEAVKARDAVSQYRTDFISIFDSHGATGYHIQDYMDWLTKTAVKDVKLKIVDEDLQRVFGKTEITVGELAEHPVFKADMEYGFSKEGLLKRLDLIDEGNRKRALDGKSALPVSYVLMLQSQLATAINPLEAHHTMVAKLNRVTKKTTGSENLAMGTNQPFEEWYTWEKAVYDYAKEHYPTEDPAQAVRTHADEILKNLTPPVPGTGGYSIIGHYTNLVNSDHKSNGIGLAPEHTLNRGEIRNNINRPSVMHHFNDENITGDTIKTTDEVRAEIERLSKELNPKWVELNRKVEEALNNLTSDDKQVIETLKTKKAELDSKKAEVAPKNEQIKQFNKEKAEIAKKLPKAQEKVADNTNYVDWAKAEVAEKEKALADYKESHKPSQAVIDGIKKLIEGYKAEVEQAKAKEATVENDINTIKARQAELKEVLDRAGVTDKENAMNDKKAEFDRLTNELATKSEELKTKQAENETLAKEIAKLDSELAKANSTKSEKADRVTKIDEEIAGIALPNIDENVYNDYKAKKDEVTKLASDIEKLNSDVSNKEALVNELRKNKQILEDGVNKLRDELNNLNAIDLNDSATFSLNATVLAEYNRGELLKTELALLERELKATEDVIEELNPKLITAKMILDKKQAEYEKHYKIYLALKAEEDAKVKAELEIASNKSKKGVPNTRDENELGTSVAILLGTTALASAMARKKKEEE